jgi:hypothetical protein
MEATSDFCIIPAGSDKGGAYAAFPYDRELVRRFRAAFPQARWREQGHWFVPGVRAEQRLTRWMAQELEALDRHADAKGRDEFVFDPLESAYLEPADELIVRTPYSRTVVEQLRATPWARWDPAERAWRVPYRSYRELRRRWPEIEAAARRNEPEARKARASGRTPDPAARQRQADRRRRRYPVPGDDLPPFGEPVGTHAGVLVFEGVEADPVDAADAVAYSHSAAEPNRHVWGLWRPPSFRELRAAKPGHGCRPEEEARGWWAAGVDEIDEARRRLRRSYRTEGEAQATFPQPHR